jgi:hypothetical protein
MILSTGLADFAIKVNLVIFLRCHEAREISVLSDPVTSLCMVLCHAFFHWFDSLWSWKLSLTLWSKFYGSMACTSTGIIQEKVHPSLTASYLFGCASQGAFRNLSC